MNKEAIALLFYKEQHKINQSSTLAPDERYQRLYELFLKLIDWLTKEERLQFTTLFAKVAYIGHRQQLSTRLQFFMHQFRRNSTSNTPKEIEYQTAINLANKVLAEVIEQFFSTPILPDLQALIPKDYPTKYEKLKVRKFIPQEKVLVLEDDSENQLLLAKSESHGASNIQIKYGLSHYNAIFNTTMNGIRSWLSYPLTMNLLQVKVDENGIYHPAGLILEPDFLVDVSMIAGCFNGKTTEISRHFLRKFKAYHSKLPLVLGNISNFFLDELVNNPKADFKATFGATFRIYPLVLSLFSDQEIRDLYSRALHHFAQLQRTVLDALPSEGFSLEEGTIEPSFYSSKYGIQGRLDLFLTGKRTGIVELKSGKIYRPNVYGVNQSHYVQTLLYDLLIESNYDGQLNPANYILYSGAKDKPLRFAPRVKAQQLEALAFRNQMIILEKRLMGIVPTLEGLALGLPLFKYLTSDGCGWLSGYEKEHVHQFEQRFNQLESIEKNYLLAFTGFIAREQHLAKTGVQGAENINGQAALWLESFQEKVESFDLLNHLKFVESRIENQREHYLVFQKSEQTAQLANFRHGDIGVLYPIQKNPNDTLKHQIFKCTLIEKDGGKVKVKLRARQTNEKVFQEWPYWNLEHDMLDSGFNAMYGQLQQWMNAPLDKRHLLLGLQAPRPGSTVELPNYTGLTQQQSQILKKALGAEDYFLLWGPPGTGKTSIMIKHLVKYLWEETNQNILLMAYTNRAVDEICSSIETIAPTIKAYYFRIGSRFASSSLFHSQLLNHKLQQVSTRQEVRNLLEKHRIVVGTVASLSNKPELFRLKSFRTAIIDEASQILEPNLIGLLPKFEKFILVGDHKQLPAVVTQDNRYTEVEELTLKQIGLTDLKNSLFDRLYKRALRQDWNWAYDQLSHQGRMHHELMQFPNQFFYENTLSILPDSIPHHQVQQRTLQVPVESAHPYAKALATHRMLFINTPIDDGVGDKKTNRYEAQSVVNILQQLAELYPEKFKEPEHIGIITPYRAQIATIKNALTAIDFEQEQVTIDTVERYQGGSRQIIIISFCTNQIDQLRTMTSITEEGVDRKLNVALTRAKEQLILIGNRVILESQPLYRELLAQCYAV